jgi:hypothetical protein
VGNSGVGSYTSLNGEIRQIVTAAGNSSFYVQPSTGFNGAVSNISIRELPGNHASQPTTTARPILRLDNGKPYLYFDGVDDQLVATGNGVIREDMLVGVAGMTEQFGSINNQLLGMYGTLTQYFGVWHHGAAQSVSARVRTSTTAVHELGVRAAANKYTALAWLQDGGINGRLDGGATQTAAYTVGTPVSGINIVLAGAPAASYRQRFYGGLVFDDATNEEQRQLVADYLGTVSALGTAM